MARSDAEWVQDIVAAIADIRADTLDMDFAAFAAKPTIVRSVLYSIAVMGEAAKNISPDFKAAYPNRSYLKFCWYGPKPAAAMIHASGVGAGPRTSIIRLQLR